MFSCGYLKLSNISGRNGTINGQGQVWWDKFHAKELTYTRGYLLELLYSNNIIISNVTFVDSPSWNLHPTYCTNVTISGITILAPLNSPNTDGIDPDSSSHVKIEDSYIVSGDDCIAVKSGWDQYGIKFNMPSQHILIRRLTCISPTSAMIALGSEMSGGIRDVRAVDNVAIDTESAVRIKSGVGRGGYVKDVFVRGLSLHTMKWVFWMTGNYGQHPDNSSDPNALPEVTGINYSDVFAENVTMAGRMEGIPNDPYTGICMSNVTAQLAPDAKKLQWNCTDVKGVASDVSPVPCPELGAAGKPCAFPEEELVIGPPELPTCSY
jgi:polygalacturonase